MCHSTPFDSFGLWSLLLYLSADSRLVGGQTGGLARHQAPQQGLLLTLLTRIECLRIGSFCLANELELGAADRCLKEAAAILRLEEKERLDMPSTGGDSLSVVFHDKRAVLVDEFSSCY